MYKPAKKIEINGIKQSGVWEIYDDSKIGAISRYGSVYKACHENNCEFVAKIILYSTLPLKYIEKEITIQNIVHSKNSDITVPIIEWFNDDIKAILIMPVLYQTVREQLTQTFEYEQMLNLFQKVFNTIFELHKLGIYHGDTHLDNFMTDENGNIKIIDFGKAGYIDNQYRIIEDYEDIYSVMNITMDGLNMKQLRILGDITISVGNMIGNMEDKISSGMTLEDVNISVF